MIRISVCFLFQPRRSKFSSQITKQKPMDAAILAMLMPKTAKAYQTEKKEKKINIFLTQPMNKTLFSLNLQRKYLQDCVFMIHSIDQIEVKMLNDYSFFIDENSLKYIMSFSSEFTSESIKNSIECHFFFM